MKKIRRIKQSLQILESILRNRMSLLKSSCQIKLSLSQKKWCKQITKFQRRLMEHEKF